MTRGWRWLSCEDLNAEESMKKNLQRAHHNGEVRWRISLKEAENRCALSILALFTVFFFFAKGGDGRSGDCLEAKKGTDPDPNQM
jgi:hypothetical protein